MKKILLTGGSGFIGKNIIESYLAKKYQIHAPKRSELDLSNDDSVKKFFQKNNNFDLVIHSATKPGHRNSTDLDGVFYDNCRMFFNLTKNSASFEKLVNIGSGSIYDMRNYQPKMREDYFGNFIPADEHGFFKYIAGKNIEKSENMIDLRVFGVFGKYENYAIRFISNAICKAIFDLPITLRQNLKFDYLYIDDLMPVLEFFIENKPVKNAYNVTPDSSIELLEIAKIIKKISGKNLEIKIGQKELGLEYSGDNSCLKKEIKDLEFTKIESAIDGLYNWYLCNQTSLDKKLLLIDK
jgi:GDP-L-fucose synthase